MSQRSRIVKPRAGEPITAVLIGQLIDTLNYLMQNIPAQDAGITRLFGLTVTIKILSNATGGEKYNAQIIGPPVAPIDPTKAIANKDIGDIPSNSFSNALFTNTSAPASATGHTLQIGGFFTGTIAGYTSENPSRVEVNGQPSGNKTLLKITGNATCGGVYTARLWQAPTSISVTGSTFSGTILGTDPGFDNSYLINLPEITKTTHDLTNASNTNQLYYVGLRWSSAADGKPCFLCLGFWNEDCS